MRTPNTKQVQAAVTDGKSGHLLVSLEREAGLWVWVGTPPPRAGPEGGLSLPTRVPGEKAAQGCGTECAGSSPLPAELVPSL